MDSALWGLQASRPPINPPSPITGLAHYTRERYRVYGDYDRARWSFSRLMGFWRGCSEDELNSPACRSHGHP